VVNKKIESGLNITREQMIQLLNEDLSGEYQAIIACTVYSQVLKGASYTDIARELEAHAGEELVHAVKIAKQIDYLGGMPGVTPKPVKTSNDPVEMLRADLENERVPEHYKAWTALAIGYRTDAAKREGAPDERDLASRQRKPLSEFVFTGQWGQPSPLVLHPDT
jgi:bacterioferritin (cytochrome b1)